MIFIFLPTRIPKIGEHVFLSVFLITPFKGPYITLSVGPNKAFKRMDGLLA